MAHAPVFFISMWAVHSQRDLQAEASMVGGKHPEWRGKALNAAMDVFTGAGGDDGSSGSGNQGDGCGTGANAYRGPRRSGCQVGGAAFRAGVDGTAEREPVCASKGRVAGRESAAGAERPG